VAGLISWSHPGQRYAFVDADPVIVCTTQSSPSNSSMRRAP
jgi:hypothetical protein